jgi:hypothetical protein
MYGAIDKLDAVAAMTLVCHCGIHGGGGVAVLPEQLRGDDV